MANGGAGVAGQVGKVKRLVDARPTAKRRRRSAGFGSRSDNRPIKSSRGGWGIQPVLDALRYSSPDWGGGPPCFISVRSCWYRPCVTRSVFLRRGG